MQEVPEYLDVRNLRWPANGDSPCPVLGCTVPADKVPSQWGDLPFCPLHRIRIHLGSRTFVYYNGPDALAKRSAALRNIVFERDYFGSRILGNAAKAETHRICHETSEDALTWNVFSRFARAGMLSKLVSSLTKQGVRDEPELYLWGLKVHLNDAPGLQNTSGSVLFPPLAKARIVFEPDITKYLTEPDIMLYVPGQMLLLVEAKFTSGNPIAKAITEGDVPGEKPKSRSGILQRYRADALPEGALVVDGAIDPFYSQLYRNVVFAIHMANQLSVPWGVVSLVGESLCHHRREAEFQDPTPSLQALLPKNSQDRFVFYSWERLYTEHVANTQGLGDLEQYMYNKSAHCTKAFSV